MPRTGGLDDQDPLWIDDMMLCLELLDFQEEQYTDKLNEALHAGRSR